MSAGRSMPWPARCTAMVDGGRCAGTSEHAGGHYAHARDREGVAAELSARLGVPCTAVPVPTLARQAPPRWILSAEGGGVDRASWRRWTCTGCGQGVERGRGQGAPPSCALCSDQGDQSCADADETPEAAAGFLMSAVAGAQTNARDRVLAAVLTWLRSTEGDWGRLAQRHGGESGVIWESAILEAKQQRDAELVALFQSMGVAL